ncbi:TIGR03862 family flavoprotein [Pseudoduganella chitinolytica]|uniref:TIGR03862 family flavoprotein n=1 Tax=Pseudoduganella chitinolytica TaxID=34070 RepID=A0ABY8BEY6_9BURK|nr:TIGR03862 family flavoprotein [Pseudoduganella chitinolytica]WEF34471.1 TIGR03862 family flavoprotein [Pseudoduganella chitinolytica]
MSTHTPQRPVVAIVGGGPAGLMAAETLAAAGTCEIHVYDAMASSGRKFLLAGRGGMNITHAEPYELFVNRYGSRAAQLRPMLDAFGPDAVRAWVHGLGVATFVGSSQRVFPTEMKAAPLLRAWLHRLREAGVHLHQRHRWSGWQDGALRFDTPAGPTAVRPAATVLALGGASWARLGSDGAWVRLLAQHGIGVAPLQPANCGFDVGWSEHFASRHAGQPLTTVAATWTDGAGQRVRRQGQFVVTATGVEGSLVYAMSAPVRDAIAAHGSATIELDLLPDLTHERVLEEVARPRGSRSLASHLQGRLHVKGVKAGLLHECLGKEEYHDPARLAAALKALPLTLRAPRPIDEAISSAGGVRFEELAGTMLRAVPGVFVAGEMLDWEAPTGGYLLTACLASGVAAGRDVARWLDARQPGYSNSTEPEPVRLTTRSSGLP